MLVPMTRRPWPITIVGWLFIAAGSVGFLYHLSKLSSGARIDVETVAILLVRLAAIVGGAFLLRGATWARWLLAAWMAFHTVLSAFHSAAELAMHLLLFTVIAYVLFRPQSSRALT